MAVIILTILYVPFKHILGKQNLHWGRNTYRNKANWLVRWRLREREGEGKGKERRKFCLYQQQVPGCQVQQNALLEQPQILRKMMSRYSLLVQKKTSMY